MSYEYFRLKSITLSLFTTALFVIPSFGITSANTNFSISPQLQQESKDAEANRLYQKIIDYVEADSDIQYSGAFIDDEGILNVGLVGKENKYRNVFKELAVNTPIKFYNGKHTYKHLRKAQIDLRKADWLKLDLGISSVYVDESKNKLVIGLQDKSANTDNIKEFVLKNTALQTEDFVFEHEGPAYPQANTVYGGLEVQSENPYGTDEFSTLSFGAIDSAGNYGVVISGHSNAGEGTAVYEGNEYIGEVTKDPSGTRYSDASFVKTQWTTVKGYIFSLPVNTYISSNYIAVGALVVRHGDNSGSDQGKIVAKYVDKAMTGGYKYNDGYVLDAIKTDVVSVAGDSGAAVTSPKNASGYVQIYGVHAAGSSTNSWYSPIEDVISELDLERPLYSSDGPRSN